MFADDTSIFSK